MSIVQNQDKLELAVLGSLVSRPKFISEIYSDCDPLVHTYPEVNEKVKKLVEQGKIEEIYIPSNSLGYPCTHFRLIDKNIYCPVSYVR